MITDTKYNFSKLEFNKVLNYIDSLIFNILFSLKQKNNEKISKFFIFGSKALNIVSKNIENQNYSDLDILCNQNYYNRIFDFLMKNNKNNLILQNQNNDELNQSSFSSLLNYQGICKVNKIKITSLFNFFDKIKDNVSFPTIIFEKLFWNTIKIFDEYVKDKYEIVYSYEIDFVVANNSENISKVITTYANTLFSSKTFLLEIISINGGKIKFRNFNSFVLFSSIFNPIYLNFTLNSLIILYTTYLKLFQKKGLSNNLKLIKRKKIKKYKNKKFNFYLDFIVNKNKHWLTYDTKMIYHFLVMNELVKFPMTNDVKYFLNKINIKSSNIYEKWYKLLERLFEIRSNNKFDTDLDYLKKLLIKCKIKLEKRNDITCSLCLDKIHKNSAIHICKNGHINHLKCIVEYEKKYCISILNCLNFKKKINLSLKHAKKCGLCRCNNLEIIDENLGFNPKNKIILNPNISGILRHKGLKIENFENTKYIPKDILFCDNVSHNLEENNNGLENYLIEKLSLFE